MTPRALRLWFLAGLGSSLIASAQTSTGPQPSTPNAATPIAATPVMPITQPTVAPVDDEMIDGIKLTDATIDHVLMLIEDWTGRTVLRPQQLPTPTFAINLKRRVPKSEAILALETLMNLNGIGIVPVGDKFLKVVDLPRMRMEAPPMIEGSTLDLPPSGQIASKLFQLDFQRVSEFLPQINMMLNGNIGGYVVFEKSNAALITDSISTLQRIELLLKKLDQPLTSGLVPKFYSIHNVKASDIVSKINSLVQGPLQSQLGSATRFTADDRTNQIVLMSDTRQYPFFDDLIAKLDIQSDPSTRNEVIYLKHADAKDVANLLSNLISNQTKSTSSNPAVRPGLIQQPAQGALPQPNQPTTTTAVAAPNISLSDLGATAQEFSGLVAIQPDERSNAVVVSGTAGDIHLIRELVDKVDILLQQVRIEVVIAEVTLSDNSSSGINSLGIGVTGSHITSLSANVAGVQGAASDGTVTGALNRANGATTLSLAAVLAPIRTRGNVEFLSDPTVVTAHNKEATIQVTQQQPVITSTLQAASALQTTPTSPSNAFDTSSSVTYKDIGITLKVKPLIGQDNSIQLHVDQTVDDVIDTVTVNGNSQPVIGHREVTSDLNIYSDEMTVVGGLQRLRRQETKGRWGILYEVPLLGQLFAPHSKQYQRTELLVFIRPHVINREENSADTNRLIDQQSKKEIIRNFINPDTRVDPEKGPKGGAAIPTTSQPAPNPKAPVQ